MTSISGAVSGITLATMLALDLIPGGWILANQLAPVFGIGATLTLCSGISFVTLLQRRQDVDTLFWSRVWLGRVGRAIFGVAKRLARTPHLGAAMTHRATEVSLGVAAEQLYERLPRETREALGDLPRILRRLQDDAHRLREWHDELGDALASAGEAASSSGYVELRSLRDEAREKLSEAVGALETVRLNLLRLHAGSETLEGFTTHLGVAAEVAAQVERIIEARAEVDRVLLFPREIARTPA